LCGQGSITGPIKLETADKMITTVTNYQKVNTNSWTQSFNTIKLYAIYMNIYSSRKENCD